LSDSLTPKQKKFCNEYLIDFNASRAAIAVGYSKKTAYSIGSENLKKPEIQIFLAKRQLELQEATGITQKRVLEEYAKVAFLDIRKLYTADGALKSITDLDDDVAGAISGIESHEEKVDSDDETEKIVVGTNRKVKTYDKVKALDSLARHLGMFAKDILELKGTLQVEQITGMQFK
jgi:phage terminase small subunit